MSSSSGVDQLTLSEQNKLLELGILNFCTSFGGRAPAGPILYSLSRTIFNHSHSFAHSAALCFFCAYTCVNCVCVFVCAWIVWAPSFGADEENAIKHKEAEVELQRKRKRSEYVRPFSPDTLLAKLRICYNSRS